MRTDDDRHLDTKDQVEPENSDSESVSDIVAEPTEAPTDTVKLGTKLPQINFKKILPALIFLLITTSIIFTIVLQQQSIGDIRNRAAEGGLYPIAEVCSGSSSAIVCRRDYPGSFEGQTNVLLNGYDCRVNRYVSYDACGTYLQSGQSCSGLVRTSNGEQYHGGFVGCQGGQNCFCGSSGDTTPVGSTYSSGSVQCYDDYANDSCALVLPTPGTSYTYGQSSYSTYSYGQSTYTTTYSYGQSTYTTTYSYGQSTYTTTYSYGQSTYTTTYSYGQSTYTTTYSYGQSTYTTTYSYGQSTYTTTYSYGQSTYTTTYSYGQSTYITDSTCTNYGNDETSGTNSELVRYNSQLTAATLVKTYPCSSGGACEFEGWDSHPSTGVLYGVSNNKKTLYKINTSNGTLTAVAAVPFHVSALSFRKSDNSLWGWVKGTGLYKINISTGAMVLIIGSSLNNVEGIAWDNGSQNLYISRDSSGTFDLRKYNPSAATISLVGPLPGKTDALDFAPANYLGGYLIGVYRDFGTLRFFTYDVVNKVIKNTYILDTVYDNVDAFAACVP